MSIANLPRVALPASRERLMWAKIMELVDHVNDLEAKLLSAEEQMEAEDIKEADAALKRDKFVSIDEVEKNLEDKLNNFDNSQ